MYLPGEDGEFGVLEMHTPIFAVLDAGELRYRKNGVVAGVAIAGGFADVSPVKVTVLAKLAILETEIGDTEALAAIEKAKDTHAGLAHDDSAEEITRLEAALARSLAKIDLARKGQGE